MNSELAQAVVQARAFLYRFHQQLAQLLSALDSQLADHGFVATNGNVTSRVGPQLNADRWLIDYLYRFYFPEDASGTGTRLIGIVIHLDPLDGWSAPVALLFGAKFETAQTHDGIWRNWTGFAQHISTALAGKTELQPVPYDTYKGFVPGASAFRGVALPLFSLTGPDDLRERVTNVLMRAHAELDA